MLLVGYDRCCDRDRCPHVLYGNAEDAPISKDSREGFLEEATVALRLG